MNAKMPELKLFRGGRVRQRQDRPVQRQRGVRCLGALRPCIARRAEAAMLESLDRSFWTLVRPVARLQALIDADPYRAFRLPATAKRVVTFTREPIDSPPTLPIEKDGARILAIQGTEIFTAYEPMPGNPVFMALIEKTFGTQVTTRTWDTAKKCAAA
ncbi:DUF1697 domain-containing protein [Lysobacter fragariae]